jgi:hypothetical protein
MVSIRRSCYALRMDRVALYDEDFHAWLLHQAAALRRLAASGLPLPNDLDLEHLAEEVEDLGNEQRFQVESNLAQALAHLIKIVALPDDPAVRHWLEEAVTFLGIAAERYRPSMRRLIDIVALWRRACRKARLTMEIYGQAAPSLPAEPPFTLDELVDPEADPRVLAARLATVIAAPGP